MINASRTGDFVKLKNLLSNAADASALLLEADSNGRTALHVALNQRIAELIIESVEREKQPYLLLMKDECGDVAINIAVSSDRYDVASYLIRVAPDEKMLYEINHDRLSTALFHARSKRVAKLLVESVNLAKRHDFLFRRERKYGGTILHEMVRKGILDVARYVCSICASILILAKDVYGKAPLYYAQNVDMIESIIEELKEPDISDLMHIRNGDGQTLLHHASEAGYDDCVDYYLKLTSYSDEELFAPDDLGETALHVARSGEIARLLLDAASDKVACMMLINCDGNTPPMSLAVLRLSGALSDMLDYVDTELMFANPDMRKILLHRNVHGQNIFHLATLSFYHETLIDVLKDYLHYITLHDLLIADANNSSPFLYMMANSSPSNLAEFLMKLPPWTRKRHLELRNKQGINCFCLQGPNSGPRQYRFEDVSGTGKTYKRTVSKVYRMDLTRDRDFEDFARKLTVENSTSGLYNPDMTINYSDIKSGILNYALGKYNLFGPFAHLTEKVS